MSLAGQKKRTRDWLLRLFVGRPLATQEAKRHKLTLLGGIPAVGLDSLASSSYGPEAALTILMPLGVVGLVYIGPILLVILVLLGLLYLSYRQTIAAYPVNGGAYTVAKENLGVAPGLLAAAALMIDYVLNSAVAISAGVGALVSAAPMLHSYILPLCLGILALITVANLRGTLEAGLTFALPTYVYVATMFSVLALGIYRMVESGGQPEPVVAPPPPGPALEVVSVWLLMHAFASGCTAMTGVEAVSNGVDSFKEPTVKHAQRTLTAIVAILGCLLAGIAYLCRVYGTSAMDQNQADYQSVLSQLVGAIVGRGGYYYITIGSLMAVLCLSANTSFVAFPRLCRILACDDFLPRWFMNVSRRLVYSTGILALASLTAALLIAFGGITDRLIPLFAVGAFLAFTLSQSGMVAHWQRESHKDPQAEDRPRFVRFKQVLNALGALGTAVALVVIIVAKFAQGAWITMLAIPTLFTLFTLVHRHYREVEHEIGSREPLHFEHQEPPVVLLPVRMWDNPTRKALEFGVRLSPNVRAVHLSQLDGEEADEEGNQLRAWWRRDVEEPARRAGLSPPELRVVRTPYRRLTTPILQQIDELHRDFPRRFVAVLLPEAIEPHWWTSLLHRGRIQRLRRALRKRNDHRAVFITVPWKLNK